MAKTCNECGHSFSEETLISFGATFVCAACKPDFLQRIHEGADKSPPKTILEKIGLGRVTSWSFTTTYQINHSLDSFTFNDRVNAFLSQRGFRNICTREAVITAERGMKLAAVIGGDPLKNFQRIIVSESQITFIVDTWFGVWRTADFNVFLAETTMLQDFLGTEVLDERIMGHAQAERKRSDFKVNLLFLVYLTGVLLLIMLAILGIRM